MGGIHLLRASLGSEKLFDQILRESAGRKPGAFAKEESPCASLRRRRRICCARAWKRLRRTIIRRQDFFKGTYPSAPYEKTLAAFARADVREVEVKVVDGNDALSFYERYGFRMNAHILRRSESTRGESSGAEE